jgi:hypothetical protein
VAQSPTDQGRNKVQTLRQDLANQFDILSSIERNLGLEAHTPEGFDDDTIDEAAFEEAAATVPGETLTPRSVAPPTQSSRPDQSFSPETRIIAFPSNLVNSGPALANSMLQFKHLEVHYRLQQASRLLGLLRESIAEKSFQYSHVRRKARNKSVVTRSRTTTTKITQRIVFLSRLYAQNRARLLRLDANNPLLNKYRPLSPTDIHSSSALMEPNQQGSKNVKLTWIWQMNATDNDESPAGLIECKSFNPLNQNPCLMMQ